MKAIVHSKIELSLAKNQHANLLLACSGGVDSMVLLYLLTQLPYTFEVAHCNFKLRATESDDDEIFVKKITSDYGISFHSKHFMTKQIAENQKISTQMAARDLRYEWFDELKDKFGFTHVLTAHHLDDQLETFLINFTRGSGLKGLTGISSKKILRPLLSFSKDEIVAYAKENKIEWREDRSNDGDDYFRNALRHNVVPRWKEISPNLLEKSEDSLQLLTLAQEALEHQINSFKDKHFTIVENGFTISVHALNSLTPLKYYLHGLFSMYGFTHITDLMSLMTAQSGKYLESTSHRLIRDRDHLLLSSFEVNAKELIYWDLTKNLSYPINLKIQEEGLPSKKTAVLDAKALKFPLCVRKSKSGDYFYPSGMEGKKKVSKYFKDQKFSLLQKEAQWLLCSGNEIVWIIGNRVDRRFAAKTNTQNTLIITCD